MRGIASEHDVALAGILASTGISETRVDDEIADAVAVDISRRAAGTSRVVVHVDAIQHEAGASVAARIGQEVREQKYRGKIPDIGSIAPKHDVALAAPGPSAGVGIDGPDDDVVDAIAVDVPGA